MYNKQTVRHANWYTNSLLVNYTPEYINKCSENWYFVKMELIRKCELWQIAKPNSLKPWQDVTESLH